MSNAQIGIVDGVGHDERRRSVTPPNHEVFEIGVRELDSASHDVVESGDALVRRPEADGNPRTVHNVAFTAMTVITIVSPLLADTTDKVVTGAGAAVSGSTRKAGLDGIEVELGTSRLPHWLAVPVGT